MVPPSFNNKKNEQQNKWEDSPEAKFKELGFRPEWIEKGADEPMITFAEKTGEYMAKNGLTNSKIRSIYGELKRIQMGKFDKEKTAFYLLRPKVAYAQGREQNNKGLQMFKLVFDKAAFLVKKESEFQNLCNLLEAILAYHRANGGKD